MSVIEKLKEAVRSVVEAERQDLYAEARLNDGRVIATEAEAFSAGAPVRVMSEDGEAAPLEAGSYELSDGGQVTVDENSAVVEMMEDKEEKVEAADHEEEKDEMAAVKAALVDKFQISPEVAAEIVEVVKEAMAPAEEVEAKEEEKEEMQTEAPVEMSAHLSAITDQMTVALEAISARLAKLEEQPAAQPDRVLPKAEFSKEIDPEPHRRRSRLQCNFPVLMNPVKSKKYDFDMYGGPTTPTRVSWHCRTLPPPSPVRRPSQTTAARLIEGVVAIRRLFTTSDSRGGASSKPPIVQVRTGPTPQLTEQIVTLE